MFDLNQIEVTASLDTALMPHPEGEFTGQIGIEEKDIEIKQDTTAEGKAWAKLNLKIHTLDPSKDVENVMGRKPTVMASFWLDLTDGGQLDVGKGRNITLGQLRDAVGLNVAGQPFRWRDLAGKTLRYRVKHTAAKDGSGRIYANAENFVRA